jgi:4-carboxymuconolactone decarboxylase
MEFPAYPDIDALPQHLKDTLATHAPVNVYKMVMHSPGLAPGFFVMADAIFQGNSLPPQSARTGNPAGRIPL